MCGLPVLQILGRPEGGTDTPSSEYILLHHRYYDSINFTHITKKLEGEMIVIQDYYVFNGLKTLRNGIFYFFSYVLFSDETTFKDTGEVNRHNCQLGHTDTLRGRDQFLFKDNGY